MWNSFQNNTLILYLLDELHYYEEGHANALRPIQQALDQSLLGEHRDSDPVTLGEMRGMMQGMESTMESFVKDHADSHPLPDPFGLLAGPSRLGEHHGPRVHPSRGQFRSYQVAGSAANRVRQSEAGQLLVSDFPKGLSIPTRLDVLEGDRWFQYVTDWKQADPGRGLEIALKDWDESWVTGRKRVRLAASRNNRRTIAEEYIHK
jgi:hypothetical protein